MKIAFIIAFKDFKDEEYFTVRQLLEKAGHQVVTVSSRPGIAWGSDGGQARVDADLKSFNLEGYEALILAGGSGTLKDIDTRLTHDLIDQAVRSSLVVGAICIAPLILARSGALPGRKMTVWTSSMDKWAAKEMVERGSEYIDQPVVIDGRLITADGPAAAADFGQALVKLLDKKTK